MKAAVRKKYGGNYMKHYKTLAIEIIAITNDVVTASDPYDPAEKDIFNTNA